MLSDFFRINLPYGISRTEKGEWFAFNREYLPIGWNDRNNEFHTGNKDSSLPIYTKYKRITEKFLKELAWDDKDGIRYDDKGKINKIWLYNDGTNPMNQSNTNNKFWEIYFEKLKKLSKFGMFH
ncbi:MAG: hypothetical protein KAI79_13190 [Bacteroidales bacterium]|nr:hypothetical protein [Bacteroidales bacterium]